MVYQQPTDLILGILPTDTPLNLNIIQSQQVMMGAFSFTFEIIGESHRVRVALHNQLVMQEILACVPLVAEDCWHYHPFKMLQNHSFARQRYQIVVYFSRTPIHLVAPQLTVQFPMIGGQIPLTQIGWKQHNEAIRWSTLHIYPNRQSTTYVYSNSIFHIQERNR